MYIVAVRFRAYGNCVPGENKRVARHSMNDPLKF